MRRGLSALLVFIGLIVVMVAGVSIYYYFSQGADFFLIVCNKNRKELEKAISVYTVSEEIDDIHGEITPSRLEILNEFLPGNKDNPRCKLGGKYFITSRGKVFCNLHGFGDRIPENKEDILPFPEEIEEKKPVVKKVTDKEREYEDMLNREISLTSPEERLFLEASLLEKKGEYFKAIGKYQQAIKIKSDESKYYEALIGAFFKAGETAKARKYAEHYLNRFGESGKVKDILEYIVNKEYFDLRLKKHLDGGIRLIFLSYDVENEEGDVDVMDINGDKRKHIVRKYPFCDMAVDGNKLFVVKGDDIYRMDMKTGRKNRIFDNGGFRIFSMMYSSLTDMIFFSSLKRSDGFEVYKVNADGSAFQRVTQNDVDDFPWDFSPNGRRLVFTTGNNSSQDVSVINVDASSEKKVVKSIVREESPDWAPTRNTIAYSSYKTERGEDGVLRRDIFLYDVADDKNINITESKNIDETYPEWSWKNDRIAFCGIDLNHRFELYIMNADGTGVKKLTDFNQSSLSGWDFDSQIVFTRDDNFLFFSAGYENQKNIYIVEISTERVLRLTSDYSDNKKIFIIGEQGDNSTGLDLLN